jgi:hypothetical protein
MAKTIRLTESELKNMIVESVKNIITESSAYFQNGDEDTEEIRLEILDKINMILNQIGGVTIEEPSETGRTKINLFSDEMGRGFQIPVEWEVTDDPQCIAYCSFWFLLPSKDWQRDTVIDLVESLPNTIEQNLGLQCFIEDIDSNDELQISVNLFM